MKNALGMMLDAGFWKNPVHPVILSKSNQTNSMETATPYVVRHKYSRCKKIVRASASIQYLASSIRARQERPNFRLFQLISG
jgi:hypothetical protein